MAWTLVTGGGKHLGAAICLALAEKGYPVVVHYRASKQEAQAIASRCQSYGVAAETIQGDFSSLPSTLDFIKRYQEKFEDTAHLINNVGNYLIKSALQTSEQEWIDLFQTNLHTPFILIKNLISSITRHRGGIINIGCSGVNDVRANTYSTAYQATKLGLWMLTRSFAKELAPQGVKVNMLSPGHLDTSVDLPKDPSRLPMHRPGYGWEIGRVVTFLLDPASEYITGQNIEVAGGVGL